MDIYLNLLFLFGGYFFGSISFARIVTKIAAPSADLEGLKIHVGDSEDQELVGIMGANAASMVLGPKLGLLVAFLDMAKVSLPMLLIKIFFPDMPYFILFSIGGLIGHNWPIYYKFVGGRGFAVIFSSFLVVDWLGALITVFGGLGFGMIILGNPMVAYVSWVFLMIPWMIWRWGTWELVFAIAMNIIFIIAVIPEIRIMQRLRKTGKYQDYVKSLYDSSPRWRGMKKMSETLWLLKPLFDKGEDRTQE